MYIIYIRVYVHVHTYIIIYTHPRSLASCATAAAETSPRVCARGKERERERGRWVVLILTARWWRRERRAPSSSFLPRSLSFCAAFCSSFHFLLLLLLLSGSFVFGGSFFLGFDATPRGMCETGYFRDGRVIFRARAGGEREREVMR